MNIYKVVPRSYENLFISKYLCGKWPHFSSCPFWSSHPERYFTEPNNSAIAGSMSEAFLFFNTLKYLLQNLLSFQSIILFSLSFSFIFGDKKSQGTRSREWGGVWKLPQAVVQTGWCEQMHCDEWASPCFVISQNVFGWYFPIDTCLC